MTFYTDEEVSLAYDAYDKVLDKTLTDSERIEALHMFLSSDPMIMNGYSPYNHLNGFKSEPFMVLVFLQYCHAFWSGKTPIVDQWTEYIRLHPNNIQKWQRTVQRLFSRSCSVVRSISFRILQDQYESRSEMLRPSLFIGDLIQNLDRLEIPRPSFTFKNFLIRSKPITIGISVSHTPPTNIDFDSMDENAIPYLSQSQPARINYGGDFRVHNRSLCMIGSDTPLTNYDKDEAIKKRFKIIPFNPNF